MKSSKLGPRKVAIIGARGYVGSELMRLLADHPGFEIVLAASRALAGEPLQTQVPGYEGELRFEETNPEMLEDLEADVLVFALPNGMVDVYVEAAERNRKRPLLLDLSADMRGKAEWFYGLPEIYRTDLSRATKIANPGCYASAMLLGLWPLRKLMDGPPSCFGVSGFSGAGTNSSRRNDPDELKGNIQPYGLIGHGHESEVAHQLGCAVNFMPHVASFFRGLSLTLNIQLKEPMDHKTLLDCYQEQYGDEPLVQVSEALPEIKAVAGTPYSHIGGFELSRDGRRIVVVSVLDNLLKGAASQALQNMNLAMGFEECTGIDL